MSHQHQQREKVEEETGPKRAFVKHKWLTRKETLEDKRKQARSITSRHREALLMSKRMHRLYELDNEQSHQQQEQSSQAITRPRAKSTDFNISSLDPLALSTSIKQTLSQLKSDTIISPTSPETILNNIKYMRKLITESDDPPFNELQDTEIISILKHHLKLNLIEFVHKEITIEALWIMAYLAGGNSIIARDILNLAPDIITLIEGKLGWHVAEMAAWTLGNLAADGPTFANRLLEAGALVPISQQMLKIEKAVEENNRDMAAAALTATWVLSNFCRNGKKAAMEILGMEGMAVKIVKLLDVMQMSVISEIAWLITYLVSKENRNVEILYQAGILEPLVRIASISLNELNGDISGVRDVLIPVLRSLGNLAAGVEVKAIKELLSCDNGSLIPVLIEYLKCNHRGIQKEAAWALSNITGCPDQCGAEAVLQTNSIELILNLFTTVGFDIKKEIGFLVANLCSNENYVNINLLKTITGNNVVMRAFIQLMRSPDMEAAHLGLSFCQTILENIKESSKLIESMDGIDAIENIQYGNHPIEIQQLASDLVDRYFGEDYES